MREGRCGHGRDNGGRCAGRCIRRPPRVSLVSRAADMEQPRVTYRAAPTPSAGRTTASIARSLRVRLQSTVRW